MPDIDIMELAKWHDITELPDSAVARTFGELVEIAAPIVEHYLSDLYRDAQWLERHMGQDPRDPWVKLEFYYAIDAWGTHIGTDELVLAHRKEAQYKFTVDHVNNVWRLTKERIL